MAEFQKTNEKWYMIEVGKSNDNFVQAGVSSKPMFELEDPVQEQIMIFRVSAVTSPSMTDESTVRIGKIFVTLYNNNVFLDTSSQLFCSSRMMWGLIDMIVCLCIVI